MGWSAFVRQLFRFFVSTCAGLILDLALYGVLVWVGLLPALANALSSAAAVVLMYFLSSRFTFRRSGGALSVVLFFAWYAISIAAISWLVQIGVDAFGLHPMLSKILSLPISFALNFIATRAIFNRFGRSSSEALA